MPFGIDFIDKDESVGEITIYGDIMDTNFWEIDGVTTPKYFKDQFDKFKNKSRINIFMNTGGGGVYAGMAIHSNLVRSKADTWGYVDGIAASIGSVVLQGCKHRVVYENSMVMIHDPSFPMFGYLDANNARKIAEDLDRCKDSIVAIYKGKSAVDETEIRRMMSQETLMVGKEITNLGFADTLEGAKDYQNHIQDGKLIINGQPMNLSGFKSVPKNLFSIVEKTFQKGTPQKQEPTKPENSFPNLENADKFFNEIESSLK